MKIALLSETLPPGKTGQAMVIERLFQGLSPESYCLISANEPDEAAAGGHGRKLPGKYYRLRPHPRLSRGHRFGLENVREAVNIPAGILSRARQVARIVEREGCGAVVACTGDLLDLPAGYLASRRAGVPFYAYLFDHYSYREYRVPIRRLWARRLEPLLMKRAAGVIATNEVLRDDLRARFGIEPTVIHNSFDIAPYEETLAEAGAENGGGEIKIVFTGDIYEAHYDAFRNLLAAIEMLGRPEVKLHLYTTRSLEELAGYGIRGAIVRHDFAAPSEVPRIQTRADLLFLPLAFDSPFPELVRTSATTKLAEYLASRRPVLVHAPPDSFISWYFRQHGCGAVVDRSDPAALARAIEQVLNDERLRRAFGERAWERARDDFSISAARAKLIRLIRQPAELARGGDCRPRGK